ncbi:MAG: hypothetical protein ACTS3T_11995 [Almyronema sp.]
MKPTNRATKVGVLTTLLGMIPAAAQAKLLDFSVEPVAEAAPVVSLPVAVVTAATPPPSPKAAPSALLDFSPPPAAAPLPTPSATHTNPPAIPATDINPPVAIGNPAPLPVPMLPPVSQTTAEAPLPPPPVVPSPLASTADLAINPLFAGGAHSLVAKAIGSAEGTRTPEGQRTAAYYGHVDPGNGVWNLGSFSYQHGATSPEEADAKQLARLQQQAVELKRQATEKALTLSLAEELNGLDLANQAPLAALDRGYVVWLNQARQLHLPESEAILWARTRSFLDPDTGTWNAPGLGNNVHDISRDQARRQQAIARAIAVHQQFTPPLPASAKAHPASISSTPTAQSFPAEPPNLRLPLAEKTESSPLSAAEKTEEYVNQFLQQNY